jgi:hypothetical protein
MSNNLRDETGALIGGLDVLAYNAGIEDFTAGDPPPEVTTPSYDLGRQRAAENAANDRAVKAWLIREDQCRDRAMEAMLSPEQYLEYRKRIDAIRAKHPIKI